MGGKAVVGLGKLGTPLAALLAAQHEVWGLDVMPAVVEELASGRYTTHEPGLVAELAMHRSRLHFTSDWSELVTHADQAFLVVPTPSSVQDPAFNAAYVEHALGCLAQEIAVQKKPNFDLVVVSTVMPGTCDRVLAPLLERLVPEPYRPSLVYSPEFIALGNVLQGMWYPDLVLIGSRDDAAAERVWRTLRGTILKAGAQDLVCKTSWINAELAKLSINAGLGWKITLANLVAVACEQFPGADVDGVTAIMGRDTRIGRKYLTGGMGFGGPCLARDIRALQYAAPQDAFQLLKHVSDFNDCQVYRAIQPLRDVPRPGPIGILGASYRDGTPVVEESQPLYCAHELQDLGYEVRIHDGWIPADSDTARRFAQFRWYNRLGDMLAGCPGLLLPKLTSQAHDLVRQPDLIPAGCLVVDCWRQLPVVPNAPYRLHALGKGPVDVQVR